MLPVQPPCVGLIFPHASAETSNTGSNLRVGVLYGFFPVAVAGVFSLALFSVFNGSSQDSISMAPFRSGCRRGGVSHTGSATKPCKYKAGHGPNRATL